MPTKSVLFAFLIAATVAIQADAQVKNVRTYAACIKYTYVNPYGKKNPPKPVKADAPEVAKCLDTITTHAREIVDSLNNKRPPSDLLKLKQGEIQVASELNPYLINEHIDFKVLKAWRNALIDDSADFNITLNDNERATLIKSFIDADHAIHDALDKRNLNQPFSAALRSGAVVANSAKSGGSDDQRSEAPAAHLSWESKNWGSESHGHFGFSFGGKLGLAPALSLVEPETPQAGAAATAEDVPAAQGTYREAFVWDVTPRLNITQGYRNAWQFSALARVGQVVLGTESTIIEKDDKSVLAIPVGNGTTRAEMFFETGFEYRLYNNPVEVIRAEGSAVSPIFSASFVVKRDNRFKKAGDLVKFDHPADRAVFSFMLDALRVADGRDIAAEGRTFTLGFGVDHEWALRGGSSGLKVPSGTRLVFRGDVDLLKAIRGR